MDLTHNASISLHRRDAIVRAGMVGLYALNIAIITSVWLSHQTHLTSLGGSLSALGGLAGLLGAYLILTQIALMSRLDWLEAAFGRDRLIRFHRLNGYAALISLTLHGTLLVTGYAITYHVDIVSQFVSFWHDYADVWRAVLGFLLLVLLVGASIWIVRRRLAFELWYGIHLTAYIAVVLAFSHQLAVGVDFVGKPLFVDYWYLLYAFTFGFLIIYRFIAPLYTSCRHNFRVHSVRQESNNTVSIYITGNDLVEYRYRAGQFAIWYFLDPALWWQGHPFSFSEAYNGQYLRLTVKNLGGYTARLQELKPGTRIIIDGPSGRFVSDLRKKTKVLLIAGGVGITPLRAMLRELAAAGVDAVLIYAARRDGQVNFKRELARFAEYAHVRVEYLLSDEPGQPRRYADEPTLRALVPDVAEREVYLCGPDAMMTSITKSLLTLGLNSRDIHSERFAF